MKKQLLFFGLLITLQGISQIVNIPDANFKAYLVGNSTINTNGDTEIQVSEATAFTAKIDCSNRFISDLTGIEEFVNLTQLVCNNNQLTSIDLTLNTALIILNINHNQLSNIDLTNNNAIHTLRTNNNQLIGLNVTNLLSLHYLDCSFNQIINLDVTSNTSLFGLNCGSNQIASLNVSNNLDLITLLCGINQLTSLDVSLNNKLVILNIPINQITTLDLSNNSDLSQFSCFSNQLTSLNIANGNNPYITNIDISFNPNLNCVQVDVIAYSNANWLAKDTHTSYGLNCSSCIVNIPDVNFKNALLNHTPTIDTDGDGEIQCSEAIAVTGTLSVANKSIVDTTGLEAFINITRLAMFSNDIQSIDLSSNVLLEQLLLENNNLSTLDISMLSLLTDFKAHSNLLVSANVANVNNSNMTRMQLQGNSSLTCIQIDNAFTPPTNGTWLKDSTANYSINCGSCVVNIPDSNFKSAILNHVPTIDTNNDGKVECTEAIAVTGLLNAANKNIADTTGLEAFVNITRLAMFGNNIQNIDVSSNLSLEQLLLENNNLTTINISMLSSLRDFKAHTNLLTSANLANGNNTNMTRMQLQVNPSLSCIKIDSGFTPPISGTWIKDTTANYTTSCPTYPIANNQNAMISNKQESKTGLKENSISIYPNPTKDEVIVKSSETIVKLSLMNINGIEVITSYEGNKLNLSRLNKGIYWLIISTETRVIKEKIIKE